MAVSVAINHDPMDEIGDITSGLESLMFESALSGEEKELTHLRTRSHALAVSACAQATYFVSCVNEARFESHKYRNRPCYITLRGPETVLWHGEGQKFSRIFFTYRELRY